MQRLPWMAYLCGLVLVTSLSTHALDINEELDNIRLLDVHPGNIVVLNRGAEDGIEVGAHARLKGSEGYAARGICVKAGMLTSHWRLYRVVDRELLSKDLNYTLIGMEDSEATREMGRVRATDFTNKVPEYDETKFHAPSNVESDMTTTLEKDKRYLDSLKTDPTLFLERNFDRAKIRRDLRIIQGSLYASPISVQKGPNDVQTYLYGASIGNVGKKYLWRTSFDKVSLRASDDKSGEDIVNDSTTANLNVTIKDINPQWDAFTDLTWRQARYGNDYAPRRHILFAPLGLGWRRYPGKRLKRWDISYAPTFDSRNHESKEANNTYNNSESDGIRHAFRLVMEYEVTPQLSIKNDFSYRPRMDTTDWALDGSDNLSQMSFEASWRIAGRWFAAYEYRWLDDAQLRRLNHMSRVVTINSFNIRYDFEI